MDPRQQKSSLSSLVSKSRDKIRAERSDEPKADVVAFAEAMSIAANRARKKTKFFQDCREDYGIEFMADVDRVSSIIDDYPHLEAVSRNVLVAYTGTNAKWDAAASAVIKYGQEIRSRENSAAFETGAAILQALGKEQTSSATLILDKFTAKLREFGEKDVKDMNIQLVQLEVLRKEMNKRAKKAGKKDDDVTKNTAAMAKEAHDRLATEVAKNMKKFMKSALLLKSACDGWIDAETSMCKKTKKLIEEYKG